MVDLRDLYLLRADGMRRRARRLLGNDVDAEEVVQEIFARLLEAPERVGRARSVDAWLSGATTHRCLNRLRDARTRARLLEALPSADPCPPGEETAALAAELLDRLTGAVREAVIRCYVDEQTYDEAAAALACSRRQVCSLLQQARALASRR
jgi:RNA polymerase sigma factor (sigma-70 family)